MINTNDLHFIEKQEGQINNIASDTINSQYKKAEKNRSHLNKTLVISQTEQQELLSHIKHIETDITHQNIINNIFNNNLFEIMDFLPENSIDLLVIDPPYNLSKDFHGLKFNKMNDNAYIDYLESWLPKMIRLLKPNGSIYLCGDWKTSYALYVVLNKYAIIQNRISWQREKGRGAKANWKNSIEDIWFATKTKDYYFNVDAVKEKKAVIAPYRNKEDGTAKDWQEEEYGKFRLTYPSNFWNDITIPYWSMPENTDHPTQKPEKLIAKLILASCPVGGIVFDPFLGSGTTAVVAKKLDRIYSGVEINQEYYLWALKRLQLASTDKRIQGYENGVFWQRNSSIAQKKTKTDKNNNEFVQELL